MPGRGRQQRIATAIARVGREKVAVRKHAGRAGYFVMQVTCVAHQIVEIELGGAAQIERVPLRRTRHQDRAGHGLSQRNGRCIVGTGNGRNLYIVDRQRVAAIRALSTDRDPARSQMIPGYEQAAYRRDCLPARRRERHRDQRTAIRCLHRDGRVQNGAACESEHGGTEQHLLDQPAVVAHRDMVGRPVAAVVIIGLDRDTDRVGQASIGEQVRPGAALAPCRGIQERHDEARCLAGTR